MLATEQEVNWPIRIGGEYATAYDGGLIRAVMPTHITGSEVHFRWLRKDGTVGSAYQMPIANFRKMFMPEDASPLPALVKSLKNIYSVSKSWHNFHHGDTVVQCDAICELLPEMRAALIAAGEKV